jgi:hypothetical protein
MDKNKSLYDPSRDTVGKIYRDLQLNGNKAPIQVGEMVGEMMKGLIDDLNETIKDGAKDFEGRPFYILVHEKKDLQMKSMLLRRMIKQLWRPWPEDDTQVWWHDPKAQETRFCWCLPHHTEMLNIIANETLFNAQLVRECKAWRNFELEYFGFMKDPMGNYVPNPHWKDQTIKSC